jgi:hypothetical protein
MTWEQFNPHILPMTIAGLSFWAAVVYGFQKDWFPALYWFSAFTLNTAVIGMAIRGGS